MAIDPSAAGEAAGIPVEAPRDGAAPADASTSVVRGAVARGATYVVSTGLIALAFVIVFRHLGVSAFGRLSAAIAIAAIVQAVGDTAINAVAQRLLVAAPLDERPALSAQLVGLRLVLMPMVAVGGIAFCLAAGYGADQVVATALACLGAVFAVAATAWSAPLMVELRATRASVVELVRQTSIAIGLAACALIGASLEGYAAVYVAAGLLSAGCALWLLAPRWRRLARPRAATVRLVAREATWLAVAITVNSLFLKVLTVVASMVTTSEQLGLFATAGRVIEVIAGLPVLMAGVAFPLLSQAAEADDHALLARALDRVVGGVVVLVGGVVVVVVVGAQPLIAIFAGQQFLAAAPVLQLQAFALLASAVTQAVVWALIALRGEKPLVVANLLGLVTLVCLGAVMMHLDGARGGAIAAITGEVLLVVATLVVLRRVRRDAVPRLWRLLLVLVLAIAAAVGGLLLPVPPIAAAILAGAVYSALALALKLVPRETFSALAVGRFAR